MSPYPFPFGVLGSRREQGLPGDGTRGAASFPGGGHDSGAEDGSPRDGVPALPAEKARSGPRRQRWLTLGGLVVFSTSLVVVVLGGRVTDRVLNLRPLPAGTAWRTFGWALLILGLVLAGWCAVLFARRQGTPVPLNPPRSLVLRGPYAWARNPMLTGVFAGLFGTGLLLRSPSTVLLWTPAYIGLHVLELKWVEEPDLVERFGEAYRSYRAAVPMFVPRLWRRR